MDKQRAMLITAGPTHEAIDDVRYIANRSSGRLGIALAEAGRDAGWNVTLLLGPCGLPVPDGVVVVRFVSTADLQAVLDERFPDCEVLIMGAAVADYRPIGKTAGKISRVDANLVVELEPTPDLVARCAERRRPGQRIVGFALDEAFKLEGRALEKLRRKRLDALVANPLATMGSDEIRARVYTPDGAISSPPALSEGDTPLTKAAFGRWLVAWIEKSLCQGLHQQSEF